MRNKPRDPSASDDHLAKVIPLRRSTDVVDWPTSSFERLARNIGGTLTKLITVADAEGVRLSPTVRQAAVLLDGSLLLPADSEMDLPWSRENALRILEDWLLSGLMDRRIFLAVSGTALMGLASEYLELEPARLPAAIESDGASATLLTQLEATIPALWALDDNHGGRRVLPYVSSQFQTAAHILRQGSHDTEVARQLFRVIAKLGQHGGWAAFDAGQHGLAQRYYFTALRAAHQAADRPLAAHILADLAFQAASTDARQQAGGLAERAMRASAATPARVRASVASRAAFAHSAAGDTRAFAACRDLAHEQLARSGLHDGDPDWVYYLTPSHVDALAGSAMIRLAQTARTQGQTRRARIWIRDGLGLLRGTAALCDTQHPHQRRAAVEGAWLALAHTLNGDLDQACEVGRLTISRLGGVQSDRCTSTLTALRGELRSGRRDNADVREFVGELDQALCAQPPRHDQGAYAQGPAV